jgi:hypothetical protein
MPCKLRQIYTNKLQLVHLRLSVKSASQPANNVFSLTKNQPAVLSASQISPGEHLIRIIRCTWRSTHPWSFSHDILCHVPCLSGVSNHIALWDKICCNKFRHDSFACDSWEMQDKTKDHACMNCLDEYCMWAAYHFISPGIPNSSTRRRQCGETENYNTGITRWLRCQVNDKPRTVNNNDRIPCYFIIYTHVVVLSYRTN